MATTENFDFLRLGGNPKIVKVLDAKGHNFPIKEVGVLNSAGVACAPGVGCHNAHPSRADGDVFVSGDKDQS